MKILDTKGPNRVSPFLFQWQLSNMAAGNIAIEYGVKGTCISLSNSLCNRYINSIGEAFRNIKHGYADVMIAGGTEASITRIRN